MTTIGALPDADGVHDATLLLYHLVHRDDRVKALAEAARVTRPGGRVIAAAISRFAGPLDFAATGRLDQRMADEARTLLTDGRNDPRIGFTHAYFHRADELAGECAAACLRDVTVHGVEGPAWTAAEAAANGSPGGHRLRRRAAARPRLQRRTRTDRGERTPARHRDW